MTKYYNERELGKGLAEYITNFLLELGAGFAYMDRLVTEYALSDINKPIGISECSLLSPCRTV